MNYVLATTESKVRWYRIEDGELVKDDVLDLQKVNIYEDKETAKKMAMRLGLQTWRYVRI